MCYLPQVQLLTATPLLLSRLVKGGKADLSSCRCLVLDEADRLFELGMLEEADAIIAAATHPDIVRGTWDCPLLCVRNAVFPCCVVVGSEGEVLCGS